MNPRANKDLAIRYWSDPTLKAWWWREDARGWIEDRRPDFDPIFARRAGLDPQRIGFAGFLPTGKHVRRTVRTVCAERRLINELYTCEGGADLVRAIFKRGVRSIVAVKTATKLLRTIQK